MITIPEGQALCPKCNGTSRIPVPLESQKWKTITAGYDKETDTFACDNCGGQFMCGVPRGYTNKRRDSDEGCLHEYTGRQAGRCYTEYSCKHCTLTFGIDSGD